MRTFLGFSVPSSPTVAKVLEDLLAFRPQPRCVAPAQLHVTLHFLGETSEDQVPDLAQALTAACQAEPPLQLELRGLGAFPRLAAPTVVWIGFRDPTRIVNLANRMAGACETLGFPRESRPFQPHLTLARIKGAAPRGLPDWIAENAQVPLGRFDVTEIHLYRSDPGPAGPVYTPVASSRLSAAGRVCPPREGQ